MLNFGLLPLPLAMANQTNWSDSGNYNWLIPELSTVELWLVCLVFGWLYWGSLEQGYPGVTHASLKLCVWVESPGCEESLLINLCLCWLLPCYWWVHPNLSESTAKSHLDSSSYEFQKFDTKLHWLIYILTILYGTLSLNLLVTDRDKAKTNMFDNIRVNCYSQWDIINTFEHVL